MSIEIGCKCLQLTVVVASSTGSTNPPNQLADAVKNEIDFWSDPEIQKEKGRFSPAAKTLMEIAALEFVGRDQKNQVTDTGKSNKSPR